MRSCEYLSVNGPQRKTKRLRLRNISFYLNHKLLPHSASNLGNAEFVSITFEDQKNDHRNETVTMHACQHHILCPVKSWARVVHRVLNHKHASPSSFVNTYYHDNKVCLVSNNDAISALRAAALCVGERRLGFKVKELGTHSLRSGAAMAMYLDDIPVYTIMMIGRWSSDAFLLYIRKQVEQFSHNVSQRMIKHTEFTHVPDVDYRISPNDPRTRNHRDNDQTRRNMGQGAQSVIPRLARFSLYS